MEKQEQRDLPEAGGDASGVANAVTVHALASSEASQGL